MIVIVPRDLGGWWALSPYSPSALPQVTGVSLEGACAHVWCPGFCGCRSEESPHLAASRTCGHGSHRTIGNRVPNWLSPQGSLQSGQTKTPNSQSFFKSCCLNVWLPISLHLDGDGDPFFGTLTGLGIASISGNPENKEGNLDSNKDLTDK